MQKCDFFEKENANECKKGIFFEVNLCKIFAKPCSPQLKYSTVQYLRLIDFFVAFLTFLLFFREFFHFCDFYVYL